MINLHFFPRVSRVSSMSNEKNFCSSSKIPRGPSLICSEKIPGVEQSSSVGYNIFTDKQEVITQRFKNRTVRKERSVSYSKMQHQSTVIALNARIWLYQEAHTHKTLEEVLWPSKELAPMQINFLRVFHLF